MGKRILVILTILIFLFNSIGYFVVFKCVQFNIKTDIKNTIKSRLDLKDLILIKIPGKSGNSDNKLIRWKEENEFWFEGSLYDVARQEIKGDTIYYYCINDSRETQLFTGLDKQVDEQLNNPARTNQYGKVFKFFKDHTYLFFGSLFPVFYTDTNPLNNLTNIHYLSYLPDTDSPPPEYFI
jgi:hypothetical protein